MMNEIQKCSEAFSNEKKRAKDKKKLLVCLS
jgi:hypothetical protein